MRRLFVIFLILLFPLNVVALSTSVSLLQAGATEHASQAAPAGVLADADAAAGAGPGAEAERQSMGDPDSDEPPSGMDFHDTVSGEGQGRPAVAPDGTISSHASSRRGLAPFPPIKPPPVR